MGRSGSSRRGVLVALGIAGRHRAMIAPHPEKSPERGAKETCPYSYFLLLLLFFPRRHHHPFARGAGGGMDGNETNAGALATEVPPPPRPVRASVARRLASATGGGAVVRSPGDWARDRDILSLEMRTSWLGDANEMECPRRFGCSFFASSAKWLSRRRQFHFTSHHLTHHNSQTISFSLLLRGHRIAFFGFPLLLFPQKYNSSNIQVFFIFFLLPKIQLGVGFQQRATRSCRRDDGGRHVPLARGPARRFAGDGLGGSVGAPVWAKP